MNIQAAEFHRLHARRGATLASIIAHHAAIRPEAPAILTSRHEVLTYGALWAQISAFGATLRANEIGKSARVAIVLPDGFELAVAIIRTACNAVAVPVNPKLTANEIDILFSRLHIDAIATSSKIDSPAREWATRHGIRQLETGSIGSAAVKISIGSAGEVKPERDLQPDDTALVVQTSATTGRSKLVPLTHGNYVVSAEREKHWFNLTPDDRSLCIAPLYYSRAIKQDLITMLLVGGSVACPAPDPDEDFIDWLVSLKPTWFVGGPTYYLTALERARARTEIPRLRSLRFLRVGSAPLSLAMRAEIEEVFGVPVLANYASTETGVMAANSVAPEGRKPGTVGRPWTGELAVRADDGRLAPPGVAGEIVARGPTVMKGYLDDDEANRAVLVDGWYRTGDLGAIDTEGFLTIQGRIKEFINRGGEKISPDEVENALLLHPDVREAAAFAVPHPRLGENLGAAVVLKPNASATSADIRRFLSDHLAPFKIPQRVLVKSEFPRGATGKTLRRALAEEAERITREATQPLAPLHSQILEIWKVLLGRSDIGIDDDFFEAGGDSLLATQMVCEVEQATHQQIPPSALRSVFTIRELAATVLRGSPKTTELVTFAKHGCGIPLFFCHGDYTSRGLYALRLADMLKGEQPVLLVHPYPHPVPELSMEEIARAYVPHILEAHPTGALYLGGHCNGGVLAWEIAHQLESLGRKIERLVLIDVPSLNARPFCRIIVQLNKFAIAVASPKIVKGFAERGIRSVWGRERHANGPYSRAISKYIPPKTTAPVTCIISEEFRPKRTYSGTPWMNLADQVSYEYVPGSHFSSIIKHADVLAHLLDDMMSPSAKR